MLKFKLIFYSRAVQIVLLIACLCMVSCKKTTPPSLPGPILVSMNLLHQPGTANNPYICGAGSPGQLVNNGKGAIRAHIIGANAIQFILEYFFTPATLSNPQVIATNGTQRAQGDGLITLGGGTTGDKFFFSVPFSDDYKIKMIYVEYGSSAPNCCGNNSSCSNPSQGKCHRWVQMLDMPLGTYPNANSFSCPIDVKDPFGFEGDCQ